MGARVREKVKGSGEWWLFIDHNGQRRSKKIGPKREAQRIAKEVTQRIAAGDLGLLENAETVKPFSFFCKEWMQYHMPLTCKASTQRDYQSILKVHLSKAPFYKKPIDQITENDIETYLIGKRKKLARSSCVHIKNALSNSFKRAVKARVVNVNPCLGAEIPRGNGKREKPLEEPYNEQEITALLNAYKNHRYSEFVLFLCKTGVRVGEASALTWDDLDLDGRKATISKGIVRGELTSTKTGKNRIIDLTPALAAELRKLRLKNKIRGQWVFQNRVGGFVDVDNFRHRVWYKMLANHGLRRIRIHDLRHSYASLLIHKTKDIHYAQKQLGHHSIQVTVDRYSHLLETDGDVRRVDVLDEAVEL